MLKRKSGRCAVTLVGASIGVALIAGCGGSNGSSSKGTSHTSGRAASSGGDINVGYVAGITGPVAAITKGELEGADAWIAKVNASGGINGHKVKLFTDDSTGVATNAVAGLTQELTQNHIVAAIGDVSSDTCDPQETVAVRYHVPILCGQLAPSMLQPAHPYAFVRYITPPIESSAFQATVKRVLTGATPKVAMVYVQSATNVPLFNAIKAGITQGGGQVVLNDALQLTDLDLTLDASKIKSSGANVVVAQVLPQATQTLMQGLKNDGLPNLPVIAEASTQSYQVMTLLKDPSLYQLTYSPFVNPESSEPAVKQYVQALKGQGVTGVQGINAQSVSLGYATMAAITGAAKLCGGDCTGPKMNAALQKTRVDLPGVNTNFAFTATRHYPQDTFQLFQWSNAKDAPVELDDNVQGNPL